jgi:hypothetical protein
MRFKRSTVLVFTTEMTGDDVRVEFHPRPSGASRHDLWRVVIRRAGEQLALDWFASLTDPPRAQDAAYFIERRIAAPIVRTGMRHSDPHRRPASHYAAWLAADEPRRPQRVA